MAEVARFSGAHRPLVGRALPLSQLVDAFERAAAGSGSAVFVAGEAGIGKTRLLEEFTTETRDRGALVAWATCRESGGAPAFWPWLQVLRARRDACTCAMDDSLARRVADAVALVDGSQPPEPHVGEQARFRLFESMATLLTHVCETGPLVVVLDDLHWADPPSLRFLKFLVPDLRASGLLVVGSFRDTDVGLDGDDGGRLLFDATSGSSVIALPGLVRSEVAELLAATTAVPSDDTLVGEILERSAGNPLFVNELARLLTTRAEAGVLEPFSIPEGVRAVISHRLARQSQGCTELLTKASVLGDEFELETLDAVVGIERVAVLELLDEATRARLVGMVDPSGRRYRFSHALVREVLYDALPLARRVELHSRAAAVLEDAGAAADERVAELAEHTLRAAPGGDADRAVEYCERAGRRALSHLAYEQAVHHFHNALEALGDDRPVGGRRTELLLSLGEALLSAGDVPSARQAFSEAADLAIAAGDAEALARAALGFGAGLGGFEVRLWDDAQLSMLEAALDALPDEEVELRAHLLARLSVALSFQESIERRLAVSEDAVALARRSGDPVVLTQALASRCDATAGPDFVAARRDAASEMVRLAASAGDVPGELLGRRLRAVAFMEAGDFDDLDVEIGAFAKGADVLRQPVYSWYVPLWRGLQAIAAGRFDDVEPWTAEAERVGALAHSDNAFMLVRSQRGCVAMLRGDSAAALDHLDVAFDSFGELPVQVRLARGSIEALAGDDTRWRQMDVVALLSELPRDAEWLEVVGLVGAAACRLGHEASAATAYDALLPYRDLFPVDGIGAGLWGVTAYRLGCVAAFLGRDAEAGAHFGEAVTIHRRRATPFFLAESLRELGRLRRDDELLAEADGLFASLGMPSAAEPSAAVAPVAPGRAAGVFRRVGDAWEVGYDGTTAQVRDLKGMHDLAALLVTPGKELAAVDLAGGAGAASPVEGLGRPGHAGELLDAEARRRYEDRIRELQADFDEAEAANDTERAARATEEMDALVEQLAAGVGLAGRPRRAGDPAERARSAVTWRIRKAIDAVSDAHPGLGRHLTRSVRTGTFCSYDPEQPIDWSVR